MCVSVSVCRHRPRAFTINGNQMREAKRRKKDKKKKKKNQNIQYTNILSYKKKYISYFVLFVVSLQACCVLQMLLLLVFCSSAIAAANVVALRCVHHHWSVLFLLIIVEKTRFDQFCAQSLSKCYLAVSEFVCASFSNFTLTWTRSNDLFNNNNKKGRNNTTHNGLLFDLQSLAYKTFNRKMKKYTQRSMQFTANNFI